MTSKIVKNIIMWILVLALQVLMFFYITPIIEYSPCIYLFLLIGLMKDVSSRINILLAGFMLGLFIDLLFNSWGVHTFATVLTIFISPFVIGLFVNFSLSETYVMTVERVGRFNYVAILFILYFTLHTTRIFTWYFSSSLFLSNIYKVFIATVISVVISLILQSIFWHSKSEDYE